MKEKKQTHNATTSISPTHQISTFLSSSRPEGMIVEGKDGVSHNLDCCHVPEPPVFLVLHIINYLMERVQCPARQVSFFSFYE